tara:strand:- start:277 stop:1689 length:1413 start_codon:yes stop_codon:yes gene_type:complete
LFKVKRICCIGAGYVGGPTMAVIAKNCPDIKIEVVDINQSRIDAWNHSNVSYLPVFEPGLGSIIENVRKVNLSFSTNVKESIRKADMIFISVNTPIKKTGIGAGETSDLRWVESCARQINEIAIGHTIVVEKSTLPVKTAQTIKDILFSSNFNDKSRSFSVLSNPEFLAEGTAIKDLEEPDRVLIGGEDKDAMYALREIYLKWVPEEKIIFTNLWSSELSKLSANAFLAQRISSINSISAICEATGANINEVANAIGKDSRIGTKFLKAGPGFGGSCFKKDILNLVYLAKYYGLYEVADFWRNVVEINNWQQKRIYQEIVRRMFGNLAEKKIAILGFAFKENTNDTRESPAISICNNLINEGAVLSIHDEKVLEDTIKNDLSENDFETRNSKGEFKNRWSFERDVYRAIENSEALIILTEWQTYKELDWHKISLKVKSPFWIFDTRSILTCEEVKKYGLNIWQLGNGDNN